MDIPEHRRAVRGRHLHRPGRRRRRRPRHARRRHDRRGPQRHRHRRRRARRHDRQRPRRPGLGLLLPLRDRRRADVRRRRRTRRREHELLHRPVALQLRFGRRLRRRRTSTAEEIAEQAFTARRHRRARVRPRARASRWSPRPATGTPTWRCRPGSTTPAPTSARRHRRARTVTNNCLDLPNEGPHVISVSRSARATTKADYSNYGLSRHRDLGPGRLVPRRLRHADVPDARATWSCRRYPLARRHRRRALADADRQPIDDFSVVSCDAGGRNCGFYTYLQGTSMASPHVAGVAALIVAGPRPGQRAAGLLARPGHGARRSSSRPPPTTPARRAGSRTTPTRVAPGDVERRLRGHDGRQRPLRRRHRQRHRGHPALEREVGHPPRTGGGCVPMPRRCPRFGWVGRQSGRGWADPVLRLTP